MNEPQENYYYYCKDPRASSHLNRQAAQQADRQGGWLAWELALHFLIVARKTINYSHNAEILNQGSDIPGESRIEERAGRVCGGMQKLNAASENRQHCQCLSFIQSFVVVVVDVVSVWKSPRKDNQRCHRALLSSLQR